MRIIIAVLLLAVFSVNAAGAEPPTLHELGLKGISLAHDMQFKEADKVFDEMIRIEPENAFGYLLKISSLRLIAEIKGVGGEQDDVYKDLTLKTIRVAEDMLKKNEDDVDAIFYLGCAYGTLGIYYTNTASWLRAYWNGRKGKNYLLEVVEKDPDYYDAYIGLGMYHYFADVLPEIIKPLSFLLGIEGNREKAIEELTLASSKSIYSKGSAKYFLAKSVYLKEGNYEAAFPLYQQLLADCPNNHFLRTQYAICCRNLKKYDLSIQIIKKSIQSKKLGEYEYLRSLLYYNLGKTYSELKEFDQAIQAYKKAYEISRLKQGKKTPVYADSLFSLGETYEEMGSIDKAREYYLMIKNSDDKDLYEEARERIILLR